ncbi:hypothetical protein [Endozoicomonas arenosclerae]|uniref:hypothetical protein n=1 Tax=Endozoicomonas arenosclerae TaxID=1633495 RepID=UPI0007805118|nr:hypothetical protein [Endozoicomonas arenosclerae]
MIPLNGSMPRVLKDIELLCPGNGLSILSYKKDRGLHVDAISESVYMITEFGYFNQEWEVDYSLLKKQLKRIFKREFPRSRFIYLKPRGKKQAQNQRELF